MNIQTRSDDLQPQIEKWRILVPLALTSYLLAYAVLERDGKVYHICDVGGPEVVDVFWVSPDYHGLPSVIFSPIHALDNKLLRPHRWDYSTRAPNPHWGHYTALPAKE